MAMNPLGSPLLAGCLLLALVAAWGRGRARRCRSGRGFVETAPGHRRLLRDLGLTEAGQFLALPAVIVSGHRDRHVARVRLGRGDRAVTAYLKREHRVPWTVRLGNALSGFGFTSRSLREARTLQALGREALGAPQWLAAGEDGRGRAFLLVREIEGAVDVRVFLRDETDPARRRAVVSRLGRTLARIHDAGFANPDLYAKHVLVQPETGEVHIVDWQRTRRVRAVGWQARGRGLAALHATLDERLLSAGERLAFLRAYLAGAQQHPEEAEAPDRLRPPSAPRRRARLRLILQGLRSYTRRLLARRHVREKRQLPGPAQAWVCVDGEALCVTPALEECSPRVPAWLPLERQPLPRGGPVSRRWQELPGGGRALLVRRRGTAGWGTLWGWLSGGPLDSPEQRQASLLLRLQRHAIEAPRVLALGQRRRRPWQVESFLLTEPPADTIALDVWLRRQAWGEERDLGAGRRHDVLRAAGALLGRLHEAACYLESAGAGGLAVRWSSKDGPAAVVDDAEAVAPRRRRSRGRERRDLARVQRALAEAGCGRTDLACFRAGYRQSLVAPGRQTAPSPPIPPPYRGGSQSRADLRSAAKRAREQTLVPRRQVDNLPREETLWQRLTRGVRRLRQRPDWPLYAGPDWSDRIMDVAVTDDFHAKQGRTTGRWVLPPPAGANGRGLTVYLKRHYRVSWWQGWLATLWPRVGWSPALREWRHLEWVRRQGVPVPPVVAAAEYIGPWGRLQSILAVEELTGMMPLHQAIPLAAARLGAAEFRRWKRTLGSEMARLARMLHDRRCFHKDLYLCHFYVARDDTAAIPAAGWQDRVYLIDLHRLAYHPWTWRLWQLKDLAQLLYSSAVSGVDVRDRLWFWLAYRGNGPRRRAGRWLRRCVWIKWQRYRRHNERHKAPLTPAPSPLGGEGRKMGKQQAMRKG
jgi:tRNA A-37 threonylcarbamoyl transferase component Bud32